VKSGKEADNIFSTFCFINASLEAHTLQQERVKQMYISTPLSILTQVHGREAIMLAFILSKGSIILF
jgi:hypothetical protein